MRTLKLMVALIAVLGWAVSAHAGTVKKVYNVSDVYGATLKTVTFLFTYSAASITGALYAAVYTNSSTFTSHQSNPPVSAWIHMQPTGLIAAKGRSVMDPWGNPDWTVKGTVSIHIEGSTQCHVATHTSMSAAVIPASCHLAALWMQTKAHCSGMCNAVLAPGCWATPPTSQYHTNTWNAKSLHCSTILFSHTANSAHYVSSCRVFLVPPIGHSCGSKSTQPHLASSDTGYHTFHLGAKVKSS